jgi:hypothetical protein
VFRAARRSGRIGPLSSWIQVSWRSARNGRGPSRLDDNKSSFPRRFEVAHQIDRRIRDD